MTGLARSNLNPELAQRLVQTILEFCVDVLEQFALLVMNQRRLMVVVDRDRQRGPLDVAAPATRAQRLGELSAQALGNGQL